MKQVIYAGPKRLLARCTECGHVINPRRSHAKRDLAADCIGCLQKAAALRRPQVEEARRQKAALKREQKRQETFPRRVLLAALKSALKWSVRNDRIVAYVGEVGCNQPSAKPVFKSEWQSLQCAKQRTFRPKGKDGDHYAHVDMDPRWSAPYTGFEAFLADMGPKPDPSYTIDRVDNDYGYWPWNCRWASKQSQTDNRRMRGPRQLKLPLASVAS